MKRIGSHLRFNKPQINDISLLHREELDDNKYNLRFGANYRLLNKIKHNSMPNKDGKSYKIKENNIHVNFEMIEETQESFKIQKIGPNNNRKNLIIMVNLRENENIMDILENLKKSYINFNYISKKGQKCYVYLQDLNGSRKFIKDMRRKDYEIQFAETVMYIERKLQGKPKTKNMSDLKVVSKQKKSHKKRVIKPKKDDNKNIIQSTMEPSLMTSEMPISSLVNNNYRQINNVPLNGILNPIIPSQFNSFMAPQNPYGNSVLDLNNYHIALIPKNKYL